MGHRLFPSCLFSAFVFFLSRRPRVWEGLGKAGSRRHCRRAAAWESSARPSATGPADGVVLQARGFGAIVREGPRRWMRGIAARTRRGGGPRPSLPAGVRAARRRARTAASGPATVAAYSLRRCAPSSLLVASSSLPHARVDAIPRLDLAAVAGERRHGSPQPGHRRPARPTASSSRRAASAPSSAEVPAGVRVAQRRARAAASGPATVAASCDISKIYQK